MPVSTDRPQQAVGARDQCRSTGDCEGICILPVGRGQPGAACQLPLCRDSRVKARAVVGDRPARAHPGSESHLPARLRSTCTPGCDSQRSRPLGARRRRKLRRRMRRGTTTRTRRPPSELRTRHRFVGAGTVQFTSKCLAPGGEASSPPQRWRGEPRSKQIGTSAHGSGFGKPVVAAVFVLHEEAGRATFAAAGSCRTWGDDAEAWHAVRGSDPLKPTEETAMARMKIAIVATCKRLGVNQRTRRTRIPARAPLAPDIASNAHPAHMVAGYQQSETTMRLPGAVQSNSPCVPATRR